MSLDYMAAIQNYWIPEKKGAANTNNGPNFVATFPYISFDP